MGKVQQGILDGFVGKVGTVVGSFWKGKAVMRGYKRIVRNPNTSDQRIIRIRFACAGRLAGAFLTAIREGFANIARSRQMTEGDIFVRENFSHIHGDISGSATVDYEDLTIARGSLPEIQYGNATFNNPLQVDVPINDDASVIGSDVHDQAFIFVYSPEAGAGILNSSKKRSDTTAAISVPAYWNGHRVHVYGFAKGATGNTQFAGVTSNSRYLGSGTIS